MIYPSYLFGFYSGVADGLPWYAPGTVTEQLHLPHVVAGVYRAHYVRIKSCLVLRSALLEIARDVLSTPYLETLQSPGSFLYTLYAQATR